MLVIIELLAFKLVVFLVIYQSGLFALGEKKALKNTQDKCWFLNLVSNLNINIECV